MYTLKNFSLQAPELSYDSVLMRMSKGLECLEAVTSSHTLTTGDFKSLLSEDGLLDDCVCTYIYLNVHVCMLLSCKKYYI